MFALSTAHRDCNGDPFWRHLRRSYHHLGPIRRANLALLSPRQSPPLTKPKPPIFRGSVDSVRLSIATHSNMSNPRKRTSEGYAADSFVVAANDYDSDDARPTKKAKSASGDANAIKSRQGKTPISTAMQQDDEGNHFWELSNSGRRVQVSEFRGKVMVNVREYYESAGKRLPGKKGISLPVDQFAALVEVLPEVERVLLQKGERVPRPKYDAETAGDGGAWAIGTTSEAEDEEAKRNFEATSDEDEG